MVKVAPEVVAAALDIHAAVMKPDQVLHDCESQS